MPKYRVTVHRVLKVYERGYHFIEAENLEAAEKWASEAEDPDEMGEYKADCQNTEFKIEQLPDDVKGFKFTNITKG